MSTVTVNISFQDSLLADIDAVAKRESRSRSELVREATREYVRDRRRLDDIFALGDRQRKRLGLTEADLHEAIRAVRSRKAQ